MRLIQVYHWAAGGRTLRYLGGNPGNSLQLEHFSPPNKNARFDDNRICSDHPTGHAVCCQWCKNMIGTLPGLTGQASKFASLILNGLGRDVKVYCAGPQIEEVNRAVKYILIHANSYRYDVLSLH